MMKKTGVILLLIFLLTGCSNGTFDKAMEQGKLALANGEYDKALSSVELALDEKPNDQEAFTMKKDLNGFHLVKQEMKDRDWDGALEKAEGMLNQEKLAIGLRKSLEDMVDTLKTNQEVSAKVATHLQDIETSVEAGELEEAQKTIEELRKGQSSVEEFSEKLASLEKRLDDELKKQQAPPIVVEPPIVQQDKSTALQLDVIPKHSGLQQQYRNKLDSIEAGLADLNYLFVNGITSEMSQAENERYTRWDNALNEIYGVLKKQLSAQDMEQLRIKQREWIKYRDHTASINAAEFAGGSFEPLTYTSTSADLTKERCYALVNLYMK
ncbi:lysozyme inhibitor LprI family protein [Sporosarcina sp. P7]|uniref:lysozyme inhibitor LprI family protein n=1 Tax=Sporosarcina sp. P7 TaxID=2048244 RepID=UPI000C1694E2|nr:lysozyme inhibitor LprI family protein [Sporosarcina sp. P7]PID23621.1 hypothetical protein CSV60_13970 [Sporosarcina sp. P7]